MKNKLDILFVDEVTNKYGFVRNKLVNYPSWINRDTKEGIEYRENELHSFKIVSGDKDFTSKDSPDMEKIKREITLEDIKESIKNDKTEEKQEPEIIDTKFVNNLPKVFDGKRIITPKDLTEFYEMFPKTTDRILLFQKTDTKFIKYLDKKKERPYVEGNIMKMEANIAFGYKVTSKIEAFPYVSIDGVAVSGWIRVDIDGKETTVSTIGIDTQIYKDGKKEQPVLTIPEMLKNAVTDMKKKALADMGFNNDVYRGEV